MAPLRAFAATRSTVVATDEERWWGRGLGDGKAMYTKLPIYENY
jgi:hypothetical protein